MLRTSMKIDYITPRAIASSSDSVKTFISRTNMSFSTIELPTKTPIIVNGAEGDV